ncbi:MAG: type II toxin-antitoxin system HipA family toxin [Candidatus Methanoplasma sp.]|nr:type II toxin-antitoxin system HipA family toxin [Candidatus Methanoplasma sp.]
MSAAVKVNIWGRPVGAAVWDRRTGCARFQFDPEFVRSGVELSPAVMPLSNDIYSFESLDRNAYKGLPGMLADSLPDKFGNTLLDIWMRRGGVNPDRFTSLDRLCYTGKRGMGALEYEPALTEGRGAENVDMDALSSLAAEAVREQEGMSADLMNDGIEDLISLGTSAGGARAKAIIALNGSTMEIRSGRGVLPDGFSHWIVKFDTEQEVKRGFCMVEHAYHRMAAECGIEMSECRLLKTKNGTHFLTKRFDRIGSEKVHMQTLCAMAHYDFTKPGIHSYEQLFSVMRRIGLPAADAEQMFRRVAFNVIMRNNDDHTKNTSFMLPKGGRWGLAPAYDITFAYKPGNRWLQEHQMSVNGRTFGITREDLMSLAHSAGVKKAADIIDGTESISSEWKDFAKDSGVPDATRERIGDAMRGGLGSF